MREEADRAKQAEEWAKQERERVQQEQERAQQAQERIKKEREEIIDWFTGSASDRIQYHAKHQTVTLLRQEGTGTWMLDNKIFQAWMAKNHRLLWIRGIRKSSSHITRSGLLTPPTHSGKRKDRSSVCSCCRFITNVDLICFVVDRSSSTTA